MRIDGRQLGSTRIGNIRLGEQKTSVGGKKHPAKLDKFRLTSPNRSLLEAAAKRYGGEVKPWNDPKHPGEFEIILDTNELPFMASEKDVETCYELWDASGLVRRCDGVEQINGDACICDPDDRECQDTLYMWIRLCELPGLGVWQLCSHGYYATVELPAPMDALVAMARRKQYPRCTLCLQQRTKMQSGKPTLKYVVPTVHTELTMEQIIGVAPVASIGSAPTQKAIAAKEKSQEDIAFKGELIQICMDAWADNKVDPISQAMARATKTKPEECAKHLYDSTGTVRWAKLKEEQLLMATEYANTGKPTTLTAEQLTEAVRQRRLEWEARTSVPNPSTAHPTDLESQPDDVVDTSTTEQDA